MLDLFRKRKHVFGVQIEKAKRLPNVYAESADFPADGKRHPSPAEFGALGPRGAGGGARRGGRGGRLGSGIRCGSLFGRHLERNLLDISCVGSRRLLGLGLRLPLHLS